MTERPFLVVGLVGCLGGSIVRSMDGKLYTPPKKTFHHLGCNSSICVHRSEKVILFTCLSFFRDGIHQFKRGMSPYRRLKRDKGRGFLPASRTKHSSGPVWQIQLKNEPMLSFFIVQFLPGYQNMHSAFRASVHNYIPGLNERSHSGRIMVFLWKKGSGTVEASRHQFLDG